MRWAYKTIHYGLKKDGLLGGTFLDENEIEESLNEYGEAGWELVSLLEVRDGVIAVFKTLIEEYSAHHAPTAAEPKELIDEEESELELEYHSYQDDNADRQDEVEADTGNGDQDTLHRDIGAIRIE